MWGRCYAEWKGRQSTHLLYPWKNAVGMIEMLTRKAHHNIVLRYVWITYRTHWLALWGSSHFQTGYVIQPQWDDDEPCCRWNLATLGVGHTTDELGIGQIHDWDRFASEYWGDRTYCRWSSLRWNEPVSGRRTPEVYLLDTTEGKTSWWSFRQHEIHYSTRHCCLLHALHRW